MPDLLRSRPEEWLHRHRRVSLCFSENFDVELGRKIAGQNAVQKIWPLMEKVLAPSRRN